MDIIGRIKFQDKIFVNKQECLGVCEAWKNHFRILVSKAARKNCDIFAETTLHELLHAWMFILEAMTKFKFSDRRQHQIIKVIMKKALCELGRHKGGKK